MYVNIFNFRSRMIYVRNSFFSFCGMFCITSQLYQVAQGLLNAICPKTLFVLPKKCENRENISVITIFVRTKIYPSQINYSCNTFILQPFTKKSNVNAFDIGQVTYQGIQALRGEGEFLRIPPSVITPLIWDQVICGLKSFKQYLYLLQYIYLV